MQEFIEQVTSQLGVGESEARSATGGILGMLKEKLGAGDFSEVLSKLPGADALVAESEQGGEEEAGGGLGGLLGKASSMLGGGGGAANLAGILGKSGLSLAKVGPFVSKLMGFLGDKLPSGLLAKVQGAMPESDGE